MRKQRSILIIADKEDVHAEAVAKKIDGRAPVLWFDGFEYRDQWELCHKIETGRATQSLFHAGQHVDISDIGGVLYRGYQASPLPIDFDEKADAVDKSEHEDAFWGTVMQAENATWINHPLAQKELLLKLNQLLYARKLGLEVPETIVTNSVKEAREFFNLHQSVIVKLLSHEFYGSKPEDELAVYTTLVDRNSFESQADAIALCPTMLQNKIEKKCDIRVNVIGDVIFAAALYSQEHIDSVIDFRNIGNLNNLRSIRWELPENIKTACCSMLSDHGLVFGAFDFALTPDDRYVFFEVNITGNWLWLEHSLEFPISQVIAEYLLGIRACQHHK